MSILEQKILNKLRSPLHVDFISNELLKLPKNKTIEYMKQLVDNNLVENLGNDYYILKKVK